MRIGKHRSMCEKIRRKENILNTLDKQPYETVYFIFKKQLQQVFDEKFESERKRQYFDAFFNISNACQEFRKELFLLDDPIPQEQVEQLISSKFDTAKYEVRKQATQFFKEKGVQ